MSRARDLANGINTLAPLASPDFTGSVDVAGEITSTVSGGSNAIFDKSTGGSIAFKQGGTSTSLIEDLQSSGGIGFYTGTGGSLTKKIEVNSSGSITTPNGGSFNGTIGASATNNLQDYVFLTLPSDQSVSHATITAINLTSETDPNGWFNTSTFKFQPDVAGKYFISLTTTGSSSTSAGYLEAIKIAVKKNNASANYTGAVLTAEVNEQSARGYIECVCASGIVDLNGSSDYLYNVVYGQTYFGAVTVDLKQDSVHFSAIRIGS